MKTIDDLKQEIIDNLGNKNLNELNFPAMMEHIDTVKAAASIPTPQSGNSCDWLWPMLILMMGSIGKPMPPAVMPPEHFAAGAVDPGKEA